VLIASAHSSPTRTPSLPAWTAGERIFSFVSGLHMLDLHHALKKAEVEADKDLKDEDNATIKDIHHHAA
jgi:hypothetical protein